MATTTKKGAKKPAKKAAPPAGNAAVLKAFQNAVSGLRTAGAALIKAGKDRNFRRKPAVQKAVLSAKKIADNIVERMIPTPTTPHH